MRTKKFFEVVLFIAFKGLSVPKNFLKPESVPLTKLWLFDMQLFINTSADKFGPLYIRNMFNKNECDMRKLWVTLILHTCASTRDIILNVVPSLSSASCIISRRGCPDNIISNNGKKIVSKISQNFRSNLNVRYLLNLPLAPWHGRFFERLIRSVKALLINDLSKNKLTHEKIQTILLENETIIKTNH